ncbi:MAG TPA: PAS domain S-box protein, partial [Candidatus Udaeobacter sp.]|nr:PAS domain S-box protein [Candidatus Udaeobacter sp.]
MTDSRDLRAGRRALILTPVGRDARLTQTILREAGIDARICPDADSLIREAGVGAACVIAAEEAITPDVHAALARFLSDQPSWSDLPLLILTVTGADSDTVQSALSSLGNVTVIERPVRVAALTSAARTAIRARERQYELRERFAPREMLAAIVESSEDAIISKTLDGTIQTWNQGAERIFGFTASEAVGRPITVLIPDDRLEEERMIIDRLTRGERVEHFETVRVTKDGRRLDVSLTISPIRDAGGRIIGASKVARDITARRRSEEALRDADRRKDEFLATLAHELRNPLAPIRNSLGLLEMAGRSDATVEHVRAMMERQVNHMVRLVDDLMEVSRITRGKIELRKERIVLADVLRGAIETSLPLIEAGALDLTITIPDEPVILDADPVRLTQVFANLLNNAAKYSEPSGRIGITVRRERREAVISIRDSGIGIARDMLPRVFDMFTQIDGSHRGSQSGLGIGLTLVRSLVQMHGGNVSAHSEGMGKGSEFTVFLPISECAELAPPPEVQRPPALVPVRVLIVDDNHDAADSLGMLLKFLGAEVAVIHDGDAALSALETFKPGMVLLDLGMPGIDGYEVARRIRSRFSSQEVMLIALT